LEKKETRLFIYGSYAFASDHAVFSVAVNKKEKDFTNDASSSEDNHQNRYYSDSLKELRDSESWWDFNWNYSKKITINHSYVDGDLTNFPILFSNTSSDFSNHARPDGYDFVFLNETNETKYNHEIEKYDNSTGELIAWVNITELSSTEDTIMWLYYGNDISETQENVEDTWDSNFTGVWHMALTPNSTDANLFIEDSTSNNNTGFCGWGELSDQIDGVIGYGYLANDPYVYAPEFFHCGNDTSVTTDLHNGFTAEIWTNSTRDIGYAFGFTDTGAAVIPGIQYNHTISGNELCDFYLGGNHYRRFNNEPIDHLDGNIHHAVFTIIGNKTGDLSSSNFTCDKKHQTEYNIYDASGWIDFTAFQIGQIGSFNQPGYLNGIIDEVRISKGVRSWEWINATYETIHNSSNFISVGIEQSQTRPSVYIVYIDDNFNESTPGWNISHFDNIQKGINVVAENGTVNVFNGTYYENVVVNKTISLISENKEATIIDGSGSGDVLYVSADRVNITGFTITNSGSSGDAGIDIRSYHSIISSNNISNNDYGIFLSNCLNNTIYNNYFNNTNNAYDDGSNTWNISKTLGTNIIDGSYLGGNYWSDYTGIDIDGDGLGDFDLPYNSSGNIQNGGDWLPLTEIGWDTTSPEITDVVDAPDPQVIGGYVNITCIVTDNVGIDEVKVNITYPDSSYHNETMMGGSYYYNSTYTMLGTYSYFIWANDTSDNSNTSATYTFNITPAPDTEPPEITNITATPGIQIPGGSVNITCDVTDNVAVDTVMVNITLPDSSYVNVSMLGGSYYYNTTYTQMGTYDYFIWANDTNWNVNTSTVYHFDIKKMYKISMSTSWDLISLPFNESIAKTTITIRNNSIDYNWTNAVNKGIILNFFYKLDGTTYTINETFEPGFGYWMWAYYSCELIFYSNAFDDNYLTTLKQQKWNMIGIPYNESLVKEDLIIQNNSIDYTWQEAIDEGIILGFIYKWDKINQIYMLSNTFDPGYGYWMYAYYDCIFKREIN
jgi:parallel beta-helix repeat protein